MAPTNRIVIVGYEDGRDCRREPPNGCQRRLGPMHQDDVGVQRGELARQLRQPVDIEVDPVVNGKVPARFVTELRQLIDESLEGRCVVVQREDAQALHPRILGRRGSRRGRAGSEPQRRQGAPACHGHSITSSDRFQADPTPARTGVTRTFP
jgi:hypothetical protein